MSKYSETIGSFIRTGAYPLEADYIFHSEEELKQFYADSEILHEGLFKVVQNETSQSLYWVYNNGGTLEFRKLIDFDSIETLFERIAQLQEDLRTEAEARESGDTELQGAVNTLVNNLQELQAVVAQHKKELQAIAGTDQDNLVEYLKSLDYKSLTELSETLRNVIGNPLNLNSLEKLERAILTLTQLTNNRADNLQSEIDQTQIGVGLSGDGSYNADKETYYLKEATSVMNALKTLDRLLHKYLHMEFHDTDTIDLEVEEIEEHPSRIITANVKIAPDSDIIVKDGNGLYHKVDITFVNGLVTLLVNGEERASFNIGIDPILEDGYYDKTQEKIILIFKLHSGEAQRVEIPTTDLILEWTSQNTSSISLHKTREVEGADVLTATLNISEELDNGAEIKDDGVFVSKNSKDLIYKDKSVEKVIETILDELDWYFEE